MLADAPVAPSSGIRAYNHVLGECGVTFFAHPELKRSLRGRFPECLDGAPFLAPAPTTALARALAQWFDECSLRLEVAGEFDDSALMKTFGADGVGVFCTPSAVRAQVCAQYGVEVLGETERIVERFYAITLERRVKNPAVNAVQAGAQAQLFARLEDAAPPQRRATRAPGRANRPERA